MVTTHLAENNKIPVLLLGISIFLGVIIFVWFYNDVNYRPLTYGSALYAVLAVISMGFWTNGAMQDYFFGIEKSYRTFLWIVVGGIVGVGFLSLSYFGLAMGAPIISNSFSNSIRGILVMWFAPVVEDLLSFSLFGFILYITRKCNKSSCSIDKKYKWLAIGIVTVFFVLLHFSAYKINFYEAPDFLGTLVGLSSVSASLIAAGIFRFVTCWFVSLNGVRNVVIAIIAHLVVNSWLFAKFTIIGLGVFSLILNSISSLI